jgi:hypothetical protein
MNESDEKLHQHSNSTTVFLYLLNHLFRCDSASSLRTLKAVRTEILTGIMNLFYFENEKKWGRVVVILFYIK